MNGRVDQKAADAAKKGEERGSADREESDRPSRESDSQVKEWVYRPQETTRQ